MTEVFTKDEIDQYTPINPIINFIDGTNEKKGDLLFDGRGIL